MREDSRIDAAGKPRMTESAFPPTDLRSFLLLCAGEWLALRSDLALGSLAAASREAGAEEDDGWHRSERGELAVVWLDPQAPGETGGLAITAPGGATRTLSFQDNGAFEAQGARGAWQLWPDGSLELCLRDGDRQIRERLWFTQPNLRLRSSVQWRDDGSPGRASFSSEIRRVSRPPAATGGSAGAA
jgi:hypothetical protein